MRELENFRKYLTEENTSQDLDKAMQQGLSKLNSISSNLDDEDLSKVVKEQKEILTESITGLVIGGVLAAPKILQWIGTGVGAIAKFFTGNESEIAKWIEEKDLTPEKQRFVIDEKSELINGKIVRFFRLTDGIELKIEEASPDCVHDLWRLVRENRNKFLQMTDWTQLADCELTTEEKKEYRSYRSYLRVLPKLYDDSSVVSAKVYWFDDWKKGSR